MTGSQSKKVVCRLLGGDGRAQLIAVPTPKLPALLLPVQPSTVVPFVQPFVTLLQAA